MFEKKHVLYTLNELYPVVSMDCYRVITHNTTPEYAESMSSLFAALFYNDVSLWEASMAYIRSNTPTPDFSPALQDVIQALQEIRADIAN